MVGFTHHLPFINICYFFFVVQSLYNLVKQYTGMQNSIYFGKKVTRKVKDGTNHQF